MTPLLHFRLMNRFVYCCNICIIIFISYVEGKGGKNRRRGKGDGEESKRELEFKEDGRAQ